jgi:hypothetical protein
MPFGVCCFVVLLLAADASGAGLIEKGKLLGVEGKRDRRKRKRKKKQLTPVCRIGEGRTTTRTSMMRYEWEYKRRGSGIKKLGNRNRGSS